MLSYFQENLLAITRSNILLNCRSSWVRWHVNQFYFYFLVVSCLGYQNSIGCYFYRLLGWSSKCVFRIPFRKLRLRDLQIPAHYTRVIYIGFWIKRCRLCCRFGRIRFVLIPSSFRWKSHFVLCVYTAFPSRYTNAAYQYVLVNHDTFLVRWPCAKSRVTLPLQRFKTVKRIRYISLPPVINYNSIRQPIETRPFTDLNCM